MRILNTLRNSVLVVAIALASPADACTRVLYVGDEGLVVTGRSMDWAEDMHSNVWVFPRGMARDGASGANTVKWTSKYGSLAITAYDAGTADGMNEKGLVMNGLYLVESDYGKPDKRPTMSVMVAGQYVLDNFATVAEVVDDLRAERFRLIAPNLPNGKAASVHMSLSDPSGDSAIFEWLDGKLVIHHGKDYRVMTNSPSFDQQLAIQQYWRGVDPLTFLPGSINAADRFVRASFLVNAIPRKADKNTLSAVPGGTYENQAMAAVLSVVRAVGTPLGVTHPTKPNLSSSLWRSVYDQKDLVLYFDSATSPNAFWVPFADLDFKPGAPVMKLTTAGGKVYAGNAASQFVAAKPFTFLGAS
ncbi:linear amide C-N hydrolase [Noviluteimonas gilva]|uniref:Linear amide C-N hydrolase n=1 Tax=Noviluteimonas gilva TaxID=2682097 RepID=A0A7C9MNP3_9GAMM|nr:linear amide C-N hydrolase [Lysobacter gilvus]MUV15487.1 linear amide C-N hydrolase [Lysobacter gilvus]